MTVLVRILPASGGSSVRHDVLYSTLDYSRRRNVGGTLTLITHPDAVPLSLLERDARLEIWRSPGNGLPYKLEMGTCFFLRKWAFACDDEGHETLSLLGFDALSLLERRVIPYPSGTTYADKNDFADNAMRAIVDENFGVAAFDAARDVSNYLEVETDVSKGAIVIMDVSKKRVLDAVKGLCDASETEGVKLSFDVLYYPTDGSFRFVVWTGFRGADRTLSSSNPLIFDRLRGNFAQPVLTYDYTNEANVIYAYGQGDGVEQTVVEADDAQALTTVFARAEEIIDARGAAQEAVAAEASAALKEKRAKVRLNGNIISVPGSLYGLDWNFGDGVTGYYRGQAFDCEIDFVHVSVSGENETIEAQLSGEKELS